MAGISFLAGVAMVTLLGSYISKMWLWGGSLAVGGLFVTNLKRTPIWIAILFFVTGMFLGYRHQHQETFMDYLENDIISLHQIDGIEGVLLETHHSSFGHVRYSVSIKEIHLKTSPSSYPITGKIMVEARNNEFVFGTYESGDRIMIHDFTVAENLLKDTENTYYQFLKDRGFQGVLRAEFEEMEHIPVNRFFLIEIANKAKHSMQSFIQQYLDPPESKVLKSIMLGNQGYLSSDMRAIFATTGTAHIIAVSGLHTGIIAMAAHEITKGLGVGIRKAKVITMAMVWFYALMAGLPISMLRAGFMITIMLLSFSFQRHYDPGNALILAAMIFVAADPSMIKSISFQLSFLATASIIVGLGFIKEKNQFQIPGSKLLIITLIVQIGTWPILAYHFKELSMMAPLSNLLILPVLGTLMILTLMAWFFSWMPLVAEIIMHVVNGILLYMIRLISMMAEWKYASISIETMPMKFLMIYYLLMLGVLLAVDMISNEKTRIHNVC